MAVDVKIGITDSSRELLVQTDKSSDDIYAVIESALSGSEQLLRLTDDKGARIIVPVTKIAYVEVGGPERTRVGFGA